MSRQTPRGEPLGPYAAKRDFARTPEPKAVRGRRAKTLSFVIQKHWASRLHYDFRLELDGVLLSWAVPKGPCFDPAEKRMAIHVEDHPVSYGGFEGTIPRGQYGAGRVIVWDRGTWEPVGDPHQGLAAGKLEFALHGEKLAGRWELIRIAKPGDRQDPWLLFKKRDAWARPLAEYDVIAALPDSVVGTPLGPAEERQAPDGGAVPAPAARPAAGRGRAAGAAAAPAASAPARRAAGAARKRAAGQAPASGAGLAAADVPGAVAAELPAKLAPQLATLAREVPATGTWLCELKLDGYRLLARLDGGRARLFTRQGNDWTSKLGPVAGAVEQLPVRSAWLDGEIVVLDEQGVPSFNALQNAFDAARPKDIVLFLFDVPFLDGYDLRAAPLQARRAVLRALLGKAEDERLRFSEDFAGDPGQILQSACAMKLEGIIAKRADAPYVSARAPSWLKLKCQERQEFVIAGFTDRAGATSQVGSLLLGYHDADGRLRYAGSVGTGWNAATAAELRRRLEPLQTQRSPFEVDDVTPGRWSRRAPGGEHWVRPELVAEISFSEWTPEGRVRAASFRGLRSDKPPPAVTRERAVNPAQAGTRARPAASPRGGGGRGDTVGTVKVSNPQRVIDRSTGLTKLDLVRYYESVATWMLPHLKDRPVALVRAPDGLDGQLFFQKHDEKQSIAGLRSLDAALWPGHPAMLTVPSARALVSAAQMNVVEFHTWNATARRIDKPDRIVFDLDPGEGVKWAQVQEAALLTRTLLSELGLKSWLKTSGGKGLHVIVPIAPRLGHDEVKAFARAAVQHLATTIPSRFVAKSGAANRVGRIFVDYLRNSEGATTAAAFSARARPGLGVSMPVAWEQLSELKSGAQWTVATAREYLSFQQEDPWADCHRSRQTLTAALGALGLGGAQRKRGLG